jgi:hypothetical protein
LDMLIGGILASDFHHNSPDFQPAELSWGNTKFLEEWHCSRNLLRSSRSDQRPKPNQGSFASVQGVDEKGMSQPALPVSRFPSHGGKATCPYVWLIQRSLWCLTSK